MFFCLVAAAVATATAEAIAAASAEAEVAVAEAAETNVADTDSSAATRTAAEETSYESIATAVATTDDAIEADTMEALYEATSADNGDHRNVHDIHKNEPYPAKDGLSTIVGETFHVEAAADDDEGRTADAATINGVNIEEHPSTEGVDSDNETPSIHGFADLETKKESSVDVDNAFPDEDSAFAEDFTSNEASHATDIATADKAGHTDGSHSDKVIASSPLVQGETPPIEGASIE